VRNFVKKTYVFALLAIGTVSVFSGFILGLLLSLCLLGSLAVFPRRSPLIYWPFGLLVSMLTLYLGYVLFWALNIDGLTVFRARLVLVSALAVFALISQVRERREESSKKTANFHLTALLLMTVVSIGTIATGLQHFYFDRTGMLAGYLSGGDHGLHIEFMIDLIKGSSQLYYSNPLSLQDYAKGVHFLLANLFLVNQTASTQSHPVQQHLVPALFEYVQLAALLQLIVIATTKIRVRHEILRSSLVLAALIALASIPKLGNHLFWSGFTTSLALTWIIFVPLAMPWSGLQNGTKPPSHLLRLLFWWALAIAVWITYQPYVLVPIACLCVEILVLLASKTPGGRWVSRVLRRAGVRSLLVFVGVAIVTASPYFLEGSNSPSIKRLILFGVCWKISPVAVLLSAVGALLFLTGSIRKNIEDYDRVADLMVLVGIFSLTATMMWLATTGDSPFTFQSEPYYVQKMYWVLFFVAIVLVIKWGVAVLDDLLARRREFVSSSIFGLLVVVLAGLPWSLGIGPIEASKHIAIDWFARDMQVDVGDIKPFNAAVFNTWENLGAHVGNIVIRRLTTSFLPVDIAQSRNAYWACSYMRDHNVNLIYTANGQGVSLINSGCDQFATYIEDGVLYKHLIPSAPDMVLNRKVTTSSFTRGPRFLVTGFNDPGIWGTWADGFHSSLQMTSVTNSTSLHAEFSLRRNELVISPLRIETYINGQRVGLVIVPNRSENINVEIPFIKAGEILSFQFTCDRNTDEILQAAGDAEFRKCVGVKDFRITENSADIPA